MCKHSRKKGFNQYNRKDTELSEGRIYQALICNICNREISNRVYDPHMYIAQR